MHPETPIMLQQAFQWAIGIMSAMWVMLGVLVMALAKIYNGKMRDMGETMNQHSTQLAALKETAITYSQAKNIFDERFEIIRDGQERIECALNHVTTSLTDINVQMAIIKDREQRRNEKPEYGM